MNGMLCAALPDVGHFAPHERIHFAHSTIYVSTKVTGMNANAFEQYDSHYASI